MRIFTSVPGFSTFNDGFTTWDRLTYYYIGKNIIFVCTHKNLDLHVIFL